MAKDMKVKDYVAQMQSGRSFVKAKMLFFILLNRAMIN